MLWIFDRRKVKLAGVRQAQHVVLQVQSVRLALRTVRTQLRNTGCETSSPHRSGKCICHLCKLRKVSLE